MLSKHKHTVICYISYINLSVDNTPSAFLHIQPATIDQHHCSYLMKCWNLKMLNLMPQLINIAPIFETVSVSSLSKGMEPISFFSAMRVPFTSSHAGRRLQTVDSLIGPIHRAPDAQHARRPSNTSETDISSSNMMDSMSSCSSVYILKNTLKCWI